MFSFSSFSFIKRLFSPSSLSAKRVVLSAYLVIDISPGNLDSSLCFFQPSVSHNVLCYCCCCRAASVVSDSVRPLRRQPTRRPCPWDSPGKNTGVGCHFLLQCMKVKSENEVAQSCPTLRDPMDCSPPGSSIHGISQARALEWVAIAFSTKRDYRHANVHPVHDVILPSLQKLRIAELSLREVSETFP